MTMEIAGDRPPRYDEKTPPLHVGRGPVPRQAIEHAGVRGGQAPALRSPNLVNLVNLVNPAPVWLLL